MAERNTSYSSRLGQMTSRMTDIVQCAICITRPVNPKVLPCQHLFCLSCITKLQNFDVEQRRCSKDKVQCPTCRRVFDVPEGGMVNLNTDYRAQEMLQLMREMCMEPREPGPSTKKLAQHSESKSKVDLVVTLAPSVVADKTKELHRHISNRLETEAIDILKSLGMGDRRRVATEFVDEKTALGFAAEQHLVQLVKFLCEDCSVNIEQSSSYTLDDTPYLAQPLWIAVACNDKELVHYLLDRGADVNCRNDTGSTPLRAAGYHGNLDISKLLVEHGADVNAVYTHGYTALMYAAGSKHVELSEYLIAKGAVVNTRSNEGYTALYTVTDVGAIDNMRLLLKHGADVNAQLSNGWSCLHRAVDDNNIEKVELLIKHGADVNIQDEDGYPPLFLAVMDKNYEMMKLLFQNGADVNIKTSCTILHLAVEGDDPGVVRLLRKHQANTCIEDKNGFDALAYAKHLGKTDMLQALT